MEEQKVYQLSVALLTRTAELSKEEFLLQFDGFEEEVEQQCDADRVVGEIFQGIRESDARGCSAAAATEPLPDIHKK